VDTHLLDAHLLDIVRILSPPLYPTPHSHVNEGWWGWGVVGYRGGWGYQDNVQQVGVQQMSVHVYMVPKCDVAGAGLS
jgi:hypothetical protein